MKKPALLAFAIGCCAASTALANPVVYMPFGTDAGGTLDGTWNAYQRDAIGRTWDESRVFAGGQLFQPTSNLGTNFGPNKNGNLVAITSAGEQAGTTAVSRGDSWIGLTDSHLTSTIDSALMPGTEGNFQWLTGETFGYTAWNGGEPNDFNGAEDAVHQTGGPGGVWNDNGIGPSLGQAGPNFGSLIEFRVNVPNSIITTIDAWKSTFYKSGATLIDSGIAADNLIGGFDQVSSATGYYTHMNMTGEGGDGLFGGDLGVVGTNGGDTNDYAVLSTGRLVITQAGSYVFATTSDDGARMRLDSNNDGIFDFSLVDDNLQGQGAPDLSAPVTLTPGAYAIEYRWWERAGGDGAELSASRDGGAFFIVGNDEGGGLNVSQIPEPGAAGLGVLSLLGLLARRRRA